MLFKDRSVPAKKSTVSDFCTLEAAAEILGLTEFGVLQLHYLEGLPMTKINVDGEPVNAFHRKDIRRFRNEARINRFYDSVNMVIHSIVYIMDQLRFVIDPLSEDFRKNRNGKPPWL